MRRFAFGVHIPVDELREMVVAGIAHPVPEWTAETSRQFELARRAAAQMARIYAASGFAVALDDVIGPAEAQALLLEPLAEYAPHPVLLRPSIEATLAQNAARTHKPFDTAILEDTIRAVYAAADLDAFAAHGWQILDTTALTLAEAVDAIVAYEPQEQRLPAPVDKRGRLSEDVFAYRMGNDKVFVSWRGKQVKILKGAEARKFLEAIAGLEGQAAQLVMAKVTGNFKRGNERR
jgi:hypothetical protein